MTTLLVTLQALKGVQMRQHKYRLTLQAVPIDNQSLMSHYSTHPCHWDHLSGLLLMFSSYATMYNSNGNIQRKCLAS